MRFIGNIYFLAYLIDGVISIADEVLKNIFGIDGLTVFRSDLANAVLLSSLVMLLFLGIDSRLPKKLFLSLIIYLLWCSFYPEPLRSLFSEQVLYFTLSVLQFGLGIAGIFYIRKLTGGKIYLSKALFSVPIFKWKMTVIYFSINVGLFLVFIVLGSYQLVTTGIAESTSGFIRLDSNGVYMTEKEYIKDKMSIRLVSMVHIGKNNYYLDIYQSMFESDTLILAEGIIDNEKLLTSFPSYTKIANFLGLVPQSSFHGQRSVDSGGCLRGDAEAHEKLFPRVIRADIDTSDFADETIHYLNNLGMIIQRNDSFLNALIAQVKWSMENMPPEVNEIILNDLIEKRNEALLIHLDKWIGEYDLIIIPWGGMHMSGIEESVLSRGFSIKTSKERLAIDFDNINWSEIWSDDAKSISVNADCLSILLSTKGLVLKCLEPFKNMPKQDNEIDNYLGNLIIESKQK